MDTELKMNITENVDLTVVEKIAALNRRKIPQHLMKNDAERNGKEFNPTSYFTVLTHLTMKDGYTLDYFYIFNDGFGGYPCLYARRSADPPFRVYLLLEPTL